MVLKRFLLGRKKQTKEMQEHPSTLSEKAFARAKQLDPQQGKSINAGTPWDWEDLERYAELEAKDKPSKPSP